MPYHRVKKKKVLWKLQACKLGRHSTSNYRKKIELKNNEATLEMEEWNVKNGEPRTEF